MKYYRELQRILPAGLALVAIAAFAGSQQPADTANVENAATQRLEASHHDLTEYDFPDSAADRYTRLTELDYRKVADELGVEVAAIKALAKIEAGNAGFVARCCAAAASRWPRHAAGHRWLSPESTCAATAHMARLSTPACARPRQ